MNGRRTDPLSVALLVIGLVMIIAGAYASSFQYARISIEDVTRNPENYLQVVRDGMLDTHARRYILTEFTVEGLTGVLSGKYYSVYLRDAYGYESQMILTPSDAAQFQKFAGKNALFNLTISVSYGHDPVPPLDPDYWYYLSANVLTMKDGASGLTYWVGAYLVGAISPNLLGQASTPLFLGGAFLVIEDLFLFIFQHFAKTQQSKK